MPGLASGVWQPEFQPKGRFFRLFLSHTSAHKQEVGQLRTALIPYGIAGFVAHDAITPTQEWQDVIVDALHSCEALAAYLTPDFSQSAWTDQEVGAAIGRGVLVVPIKVGQDPYGFIGRYQALTDSGVGAEMLAAQLAGILQTHPLTKDAMAEAVVDRFVKSPSWNDARANLKWLEQLPRDVWTPTLVDAVRQGVAENGEIQEAEIGFGVSSVGAEALKLMSDLTGA